MQYLVDKYDPNHKVSYPFGSKEYYETNNWVRFRTEPSRGRLSRMLTRPNSSTGRWEDVRNLPHLYIFEPRGRNLKDLCNIKQCCGSLI